MYFSQNKIKTIIEIAKIPKFSNLWFMGNFLCLALNALLRILLHQKDTKMQFVLKKKKSDYCVIFCEIISAERGIRTPACLRTQALKARALPG